LKLLTGTYIFEKKWARYISESNSICKLCDEEVEDIEHFLLSCPILNSTRLRYYSRLDHLTELLYNEPFSTLSNIKKLHILLDHSAIPCTSLLVQNITKKRRNYYEAHETELHNVKNFNVLFVTQSSISISTNQKIRKAKK
jgi:hypothetical protein